MPGTVIAAARELVQRLETKLDEVKTGMLRRQARALAAKTRLALLDSAPLTREQRIVEAAETRRGVDLAILK